MVGRGNSLSETPRSPNHLLASLPDEDFELLRPFLRTVTLSQETILAETGQTVRRIYFPHSGVISIVVGLNLGEMIEVAMVGRDSAYGAFAALAAQPAFNSAIVHVPGVASVIEARHVRAASEQSATLRATLFRNELILFMQAQQSAACNAAHVVESRLSRWLLHMGDLSGSNTLGLTQEFLAQMLGVQRNRISVVAKKLQQAGVIRCHRGMIEIADRDALIEIACECYGTVKTRYDGLFDS
jgi:CRP-like cAMP-binding protein